MMQAGRKDHLDALAVAVLVSCCTIWGLAQVAAKVTLTEVPPLLQSGARSLGAALLLLVWSRWRGLKVLQGDGGGGAGPAVGSITQAGVAAGSTTQAGLAAGRTMKAGLAAGIMFAAEFACMFIGLQYTTASRMVVFLYTAPFVVAIFMPLIARNERLTWLQVGGLVLAFGGVVWAFAEGFSDPAAGRLQWLGDALGLAAAVLWGATTLLVRGTPLATALPEKTLLYQLVVSAAALLAASALFGEAWPRALSAQVALLMLFQVAVVTFASYLAWFWLVRHYPATKASAFTLLTPLLGLLAGVLLLGEPLTPRLLVALVAVCGGIAIVNLAPKTAKP